MFKTPEEFRQSLKYADNSPHVGHRYWETRQLDIAEVAKLVRKDIKDLVVRHKLPRGSYRVYIQRYAGGQSLNVVAKLSKVTRENYGTVCKVRLEDLLDSYNYDGSNSRYDYFSQKFHGFVNLESETDK